MIEWFRSTSLDITVTNNYQVQSVWSKKQTNMGEKLTEIKNHQSTESRPMSDKWRILLGLISNSLLVLGGILQEIKYYVDKSCTGITRNQLLKTIFPQKEQVNTAVRVTDILSASSVICRMKAYSYVFLALCFIRKKGPTLKDFSILL